MDQRGFRNTLLPHQLHQKNFNVGSTILTPIAEEKQSLQDPNTPELTDFQKEGPKTLLKKPKGQRDGVRFPVHPREQQGPWEKYHKILETNQAGPSTIAHDNSLDHRIVVVKNIKSHAGEMQQRQLHQIISEAPPNIVHIVDIFISLLEVHVVYETLETSLHHIQATSRQEITEIDLAIIGKEVLQGLQYIHSSLGIFYGQLVLSNVLVSNNGNIKLANIATSVLTPQKGSYAKDTAAVGWLLVGVKEPGTSQRNPEGFEFEGDVSELCQSFVKSTDTSSIPSLLKHDFLLKSPGVGRMKIFVYRAMEFAARWNLG